MPNGAWPVASVVFALVEVSIRVTVPARALLTQTAPSPATTLSAPPLMEILVPTGWPVSALSLITPSSALVVSHTKPPAAAMLVISDRTAGAFQATVLVAGLSLCTCPRPST